ncbi:hypothetical protein [Sinimarinibacterium flocculans]|uniref:hypothetical protein n=1 Tax=Sinimarinibacterium flocculans TaxID=985250 RepID=UPI003519C7F4
MNRAPDRTTVPLDETAHAIHALTDLDLHRLLNIAELYARGTILQAQDVLQEAVCRALMGRRKCTEGKDVMRFLAETMKSIVSDERRSWWSQHVEGSGDLIEQDAANDDAIGQESTGDGDEVLEGLLLSELYNQVQSLFSDDEAAVLTLSGLFAGDSPEDIREALGIGKTEYATIRRRIRRRIDAAFPDGWRP